MLIVTCTLCVIYAREDNDYDYTVYINNIASGCLWKAVKFKHSQKSQIGHEYCSFDIFDSYWFLSKSRPIQSSEMRA